MEWILALIIAFVVGWWGGSLYKAHEWGELSRAEREDWQTIIREWKRSVKEWQDTMGESRAQVEYLKDVMGSCLAIVNDGERVK